MSKLNGKLTNTAKVVGSLGVGGGGGTGDYNELTNKPKINGVQLSGDKSSSELGILTIDDVIDDVNTSDSKTYSSDKVEALLYDLLPIDNASGAVASFSTSLQKPLISLKVDIDYKAGGINEVNLYQLGSNFFDKNSENIRVGYLINGGGNEVSYADWNVSDFVPVLEGAKYYLYGITQHPNTNQDNFELFDVNKVKTGFANVKVVDQPFVIPAGVKYVKFSVKNPDINTAQFGVSKNLFYEPYNPIVNLETIDISGFGVYGGYIEITPTTAKLFSTKNPDGTDKDTPEVYDLEGVTDFTALIGTNNVLADCGNIAECKFKDGIQHYIDKLV